MAIPPIRPLAIDGNEVDISYYLSREYDNIEDASAELPALVEWINEQHQIHFTDKAILEEECRKLESTLYFKLKQGDFSDKFRCKVTEKALEYAINCDESLYKMRIEVANLSGWCSRLNNLKYSLQSKLDLLRSAEASRRKYVENTENN